eukprot:TRINITY_DN2580_c0_g1_i1.p1 TRINITY_DN2580_c0_g1~~TRINITY_DN2580_c0_g1_i1.p1  ORF type:complete len:727 (-),score=112.11 TRINITY_DN2580_c0_g1_i1:15-2195(-)
MCKGQYTSRTDVHGLTSAHQEFILQKETPLVFIQEGNKVGVRLLLTAIFQWRLQMLSLPSDKKKLGIIAFATLYVISKNRRLPGPDEGKQRKNQDKKIAVDMKFFRRLLKILSITFPSLASQETLYLFMLSLMLVLRTSLSVVIARITGKNGQMLVARQWKRFLFGVYTFMIVTIPAAGVNAALKYYTNVLALRIRVRLSEYVNDEYLRGVNFYKAANFGGENKLDSPDQRVTSDINNFAEAISQLYSETFKPVLDVILFTHQLCIILGWQGPAFMYLYFILSAIAKKKIMPAFGKLVAKESELEGFYRTAHTRLVANAEEIAFYDGSPKEKTIIEQALHKIYQHVAYVRKSKGWVGILDGLLVKYWASLAGYFVVASPFLLNLEHSRDQTTEQITRDYILNTQYLQGLSLAVGQLVLVGNKLTAIAGYTHRVSELLEMVAHLNAAGNRPFKIMPQEQDDFSTVVRTPEWMAAWRHRCDEQRSLRFALRHDVARDVQRIHGGGTVIDGASDIQFEHCDLVAPDGQLLARDLSFTVEPGVNVMVTGPNGCGKSSLFRVIGELWPLHSGKLRKPRREDVLFVPQKPYLVLGSLRDQIIYPHSKDDMDRLGVTDDDLRHLLAAVDPNQAIAGTWNFDDVKDWFTALSGGQKQRIAMARLFYHCPQFAILDECTSAVSDEVEDAIYETCKELGITIFTVSHRPALRKHHQFILAFDGRGSWSWTKIDHSE